MAECQCRTCSVLPAELCRSIVDRSSEAVAVCVGDDLVFRYVNDAYRALAPGKPMFNERHSDVWPEAFDVMEPELTGALKGAPFEAKDVMLAVSRAADAPVERRYFSYTYTPIRYDGLPSVLIIGRETTEQVRERRTEELTRALNTIDGLVHSTLDFEEVMARALEAAATTLGASVGFVSKVGEDTARVLFRYPDSPDIAAIGHEFTRDQAPFIWTLRETREPMVVADTAGDPHFQPEAHARYGAPAFLAIPLVVRGEVPAVLGLNFAEPGDFGEEDVRFLSKLGGTISLALENARLFAEHTAALEALVAKDRAIRQAYSDVIDAATGGRLVLLGEDELRSVLAPTTLLEDDIADASELAAGRRRVRDVLADTPAADDLVLAFGEASTNALRHGGCCHYSVRHGSGRAQLVVSDAGPGIDFAKLPKATLVPGYSTKQTLGMGFTLMLELADRLVMSTGDTGTTVIIERFDASSAPEV